MGLAAWVKEDTSDLGVELEGLRGEVRNLRREKDVLNGEVRCLVRTKENVEAQILERNAELLQIESQWDSDPGRFGLMGAFAPICQDSSSKLAPRASGQQDAIDLRIQTLTQDKKDLGTLNRALTDRLSESMRHLRNAQANSCSTCSLRSSTTSLPPPFVDKFEHEYDEPPGWSEVTQSCYMPENLPPNPDRNRRQIAHDDSPEGGEAPGGLVGVGDVDLLDSIICVVDGHPDLSPIASANSRNKLEGNNIVTVPGDSGLGDFCLPDSYFDIDYPETVDCSPVPTFLL
jgi:hypothetical protein